MKNDGNFNQQLIGFGIPVGTLSGLAAAFIARAELSAILPQGIAGGILTAALIAIIINGFAGEFSLSKLLAAGIISGAIAGSWLGLLAAWTIDGSYLYGAITGIGTGLVGGALIILLTYHFSEREDTNY